jgi:hypothetical protein
VQHCLDKHLIGIGWRLDDLPSRTPREKVLETIRNKTDDGWGQPAANIVRRIAVDAKKGEFVWTRDTEGRYLLCRITGPWRYDNSKAAAKVDVHQVRPVDWAPRPLNDLEVPGGVIRCFIGTGTSFSRIHDVPARQMTVFLWEKLHGRRLPALNLTSEQVLTSHLDPYDVEDLVYVWLQVQRDYVAFPRARQRDMPAYEWTMINRKTGRRGIVQVKTGDTHVDLAALADAVADDETDTYAFATCGEYDGDQRLVTEVIKPTQLLRFAREKPSMLPLRVRTWFELASG